MLTGEKINVVEIISPGAKKNSINMSKGSVYSSNEKKILVLLKEFPVGL